MFKVAPRPNPSVCLTGESSLSLSLSLRFLCHDVFTHPLCSWTSLHVRTMHPPRRDMTIFTAAGTVWSILCPKPMLSQHPRLVSLDVHSISSIQPVPLVISLLSPEDIHTATHGSFPDNIICDIWITASPVLPSVPQLRVHVTWVVINWYPNNATKVTIAT